MVVLPAFARPTIRIRKRPNFLRRFSKPHALSSIQLASSLKSLLFAVVILESVHELGKVEVEGYSVMARARKGPGKGASGSIPISDNGQFEASFGASGKE